MAHIHLKNELPGISGLLFDFPETAKPLCDLAETLLRKPHSLTSGERELIAAYVSHKNNCNFCHSSHAAAATAHLKDDYELIDAVLADINTAPVSDKMKALLIIAGQVQQSGLAVKEEDVLKAKNAGATDAELHITVLIAAAFCMYNRYVDGLSTWSPKGREPYKEMGKRMAEVGYLRTGQ
ncbi:MAG: carboxymuconolactone decarboxylase [Bacteroidota bacterium]|nr:carboxymuconolactone decarboxylase [Bacteroidota bacterium]